MTLLQTYRCEFHINDGSDDQIHIVLLGVYCHAAKYKRENTLEDIENCGDRVNLGELGYLFGLGELADVVSPIWPHLPGQELVVVEESESLPVLALVFVDGVEDDVGWITDFGMFADLEIHVVDREVLLDVCDVGEWQVPDVAGSGL